MNRVNHLRISPEGNADRPFAARLRGMSPDLITLADVRLELCGDTLATVEITEDGRFASEFLIEAIGADRDMDCGKWQAENRALYAVEGAALDSPGARGRQFFTRDQLTRLALRRRLCEDGMLRARFCIVNDAGPMDDCDARPMARRTALAGEGMPRGTHAAVNNFHGVNHICIVNGPESMALAGDRTPRPQFCIVNNFPGMDGDTDTDQCAGPWTSPGRLHAVAGQGKGHANVQPGRAAHGQGNGQKRGL